VGNHCAINCDFGWTFGGCVLCIIYVIIIDKRF